MNTENILTQLRYWQTTPAICLETREHDKEAVFSETEIKGTRREAAEDHWRPCCVGVGKASRVSQHL